MRAGSLRHTITIERRSETVTASGGVVTAWTPVATARAEIVNTSAAEFLTGFGAAQARTVVFLVRALDGITTADRIVHDGWAHDLKEIVEIERGRGLELRAVATS